MKISSYVDYRSHLGILGWGLAVGEGGGGGRDWLELGGLEGPGREGREGAVGAPPPPPPYERGLGGAKEESGASS